MKLNVYLKGKSRKEFAEKVGTTENYINNLCSNSRYIPSRKLAEIIERATLGQVPRLELLYPENKKTN